MADKEAIPSPYNAALMLADGNVFYGFGIGAYGTGLGEICFNTGLTGYQETLSDPSYAGQIITFTFPHIGNVGTNVEDMESRQMFAEGLVVREAITDPSNFRADSHLNAWLETQQKTGISGIDTRALTRHIRLRGAQNAAIIFPKSDISFDEIRTQLTNTPGLAGQELARSVTTTERYGWTQTSWKLGEGFGENISGTHHVVAIDYGEKLNILRLLAETGFKVTVVPADTHAEDILALKPDGVFLSNGPGDPAATAKYAAPAIKKLLSKNIPIFGICLGHQLLALAVGGETEKMFQGHRGANHPVQNIQTGRVEVTSQNHGFVVKQSSLPNNAQVTHLSLFDGSVEGFRLTDKPAFAVQYHPESSPGPHDSRFLFRQFATLIEEFRSHN